MKERESVKLKESVNTAKPGTGDHHQSLYSQSLLAVLATDSQELKMA